MLTRIKMPQMMICIWISGKSQLQLTFTSEAKGMAANHETTNNRKENLKLSFDRTDPTLSEGATPRPSLSCYRSTCVFSGF